jgi:hypothetical protein
MKTNTRLLAALCALLPAAGLAEDCNCAAKNIDASPAVRGKDGRLWVYGKPCADFDFDAWPVLTCTGFNQDWIRDDCKTNVLVHHDPGCKPLESITVSFDVDCVFGQG